MVFSDDDDLISQFLEEEDDDEYVNDGDYDDIIAFFYACQQFIYMQYK